MGDSNPRYGNPYVSLANWWFQPLTQPSSTRSGLSNRHLSFKKRVQRYKIFLTLASFFTFFFIKSSTSLISDGFLPIKSPPKTATPTLLRSFYPQKSLLLFKKLLSPRYIFSFPLRDFMFPVQKLLYTGRKLLYTVQKHKFTGRKQKIVLGVTKKLPRQAKKFS